MTLPRSFANIPPALPFIHKLANRVFCNIGCCCYIFAMTVGLDSTRDEEGLSGCLVCPCHRAAALTPAERTAASVSLQRFTLPSLYRSELGFSAAQPRAKPGGHSDGRFCRLPPPPRPGWPYRNASRFQIRACGLSTYTSLLLDPPQGPAPDALTP